MALIKCPECGKEISDKATLCPNCGYPISQISEDMSGKQEMHLVEENVKSEKKHISVKSIVSIGVGIVALIGILIGKLNLLCIHKRVLEE